MTKTTDVLPGKTDQDLEAGLAGLFAELLLDDVPSAIAGLADLAPTYSLEALFSDKAEPAVRSQPPAVLTPRPEPEKPIRPKAVLTQSPAQPPVPEKVIVGQPAPQPSFEDRLLQGLQSQDPQQRRRAVEYLAQIEQSWVIDPLLHAAVDRDSGVVAVALTGLLRLSNLVNQRIISLAQQPPPPLLQRGSEAYLSYLMGQPFVHIPAGPALIGSHPTVDRLTNPNEQPQHTLQLTGYWISRYPVTVAHYRAFVAETGYRFKGSGYGRLSDNFAVVGVSWYDALEYCRWLTRRSGLQVLLPSEPEWEKAARGHDGRRYPWGNQPPTEQLGNFQRATPVGHYSPQGDSPYGCADMVGNVWEWSRSLYRPYPYNPRDGRESLTRESLKKEEARVIRGLTFNQDVRFTRAAFRYSLRPRLHLKHLGFRVVIVPG